MSQSVKEEINLKFGGKVRPRVGGILIEDNCVLLLKHEHIGRGGYLWAPPGGGIEHGQSVEEALKREFLEETGLEIEIKNLLLVNEFIDDPLHALELFFEVKRISGRLQLGSDPEMETGQILSKAAFFSIENLKKEENIHIHNIFHGINSFNELYNTKGYFKFVNNSIK